MRAINMHDMIFDILYIVRQKMFIHQPNEVKKIQVNKTS